MPTAGRYKYIIVSIIFIVSICLSEELKMAFGQHRPPFVFKENNEWRGIEIDLVREALAYKGHSIKKMVHMPNARLAIATSQMGYDGAASVQYLDDGTFYSDPFVSYINYAISLKKDNLKISKISDLTNHFPVAWQNAYRNLGPEFAQYYGPNVEGAHLKRYKEFTNQESQNMFFWIGRANVIIVDKTIFLWYKAKLKTELNTSREVVFHNIFPQETHFQVNFKDKRIRDDFNEGLLYLRQSGRYDEIVNLWLQ